MDNSTVSLASVQAVSQKWQCAPQTAIYMRVSTNQQTTRSQKPDLERWVAAQDPDLLGKVVWYSDKATGKNMCACQAVIGPLSDR